MDKTFGNWGTTRVVGIYVDPLVTSGDIVKFSDHDSQYRFRNDLEIDNLVAKHAGDYDSDGAVSYTHLTLPTTMVV